MKAQTSTEFIVLAVVASYLIFFVTSLAIDIPDLTRLETDAQTRQYYASLPLAIIDVYTNSSHTDFLLVNSFKEPVIIHTITANTDIFFFDTVLDAGEMNFFTLNKSFTQDIFLSVNYTLQWSNSVKNISYAQKYPLN